MKIIVPLLLAAFAGVGCSSKYVRMTENDLQLVDQSHKGVKGAKSDLSSEPPKVDAAQKKLDVVDANLGQLKSVTGDPAEPTEFDPGKSKQARDGSKNDHSATGWWVGAGGVLVTLLTIATTVLRGTPAGQIADAAAEAYHLLRGKAKDGPVSEADADTALDEVKKKLPPKLKARMDDTLKRVKKKLNGGSHPPTGPGGEGTTAPPA